MKLLEQVVLSREDITKIENFFKIYDSDKKSPPSMTERLRAELDVLSSKIDNNTYTVEDQRRLAIALCHAISVSQNAKLQNGIMDELKTACKEEWDNESFHEELERTIATPATPSSES